jgi:hypothetical protein
VVGEPCGERRIVRVTTTRVLLECKCGSTNAIPIRRLEKEKPQRCRRCNGGEEPGTRGASTQIAIGQRFGTRTVAAMEPRVRRSNVSAVYARMVCDCGHEGWVEPSKLVSGIAQACPRCADALRGIPLRDRVESEGRCKTD